MFWRQSAGRASSSPVSANRVRFSFEISAWEKYPGRVKYGRLSLHRMGNSPMLDVRFELTNRRKRGNTSESAIGRFELPVVLSLRKSRFIARHFIGLGLRGVIFTGDATSLATIDVGANSHGNRRKFKISRTVVFRDIYLTERAVREPGEFEFAGSHALGSRLQGQKVTAN